MKADFSRSTYALHKHYRRVLGQQGRVVIDADRNEQTAIDIGVAEQTTADVIGPSGVPEASFAYGYTGGFQIGVSADGSDLTISRGRIYVDGMLIENDADTTLSTQPFLPLPKTTLGAAGISGDGTYGVYLDAWERLITPVDDPDIVEVALGGPDTALRSQIAWQVKLGSIDTSEFGTNPVCAQILAPWGFAGTPGQLAAQGGAPSTEPLPCVLPPQTGFRSLENQLYRVEIHTAGSYGSATFKWSRENGSVIAGIVSQLSGPFASPTFNVQTVGRDSTLGFATGDWVELIDDTAEWQTGAGELLRVGTVDNANLRISLQTSPTLTIDATKHPKLRRWDQTQNATASGIAIPDGNWIDLENGVQVQFSAGNFHVGDYWLIPARTATSAQTIGAVEWPIDSATGAPQLQDPAGITHHYTKLAIVAFAGGVFAPPQGTSAVTDCRLFFPPLTGIEATGGPCTLVVQPGTNWSAPLVAFFAANPAVDAEICFAVGQFPTTQTVTLATTGNVKVTGAGWGTQLAGTNVETVLRFSGCASASVSDLAASAARVDAPLDATTDGINGVLEFDDCADVRVTGVALHCGSGIRRGAACLTVRSSITAANTTTGAGTARIADSSFTVGENQYGMLLVHQAHVFVERNELAVVAGAATIRFADLLKDTVFVAQFARLLVGSATLGAPAASSSTSAASEASASSSSVGSGGSQASTTVSGESSLAGSPLPGPARHEIPLHPALRAKALTAADGTPVRAFTLPPNSGVSVGKTTVQFNTPSLLKNVWQTYVDQNAPKEFATNTDLLNYVRSAAAKLLTDPAARANFSEFNSVVHQFESRNVAVAYKGIAVGGRGISELRIRDNSIGGFMQGITVGVSHKEKRPPAVPPDAVGTLTISGNSITVSVNPVSGHLNARFGIFVGNADRVQIENNELTFAFNAALVAIAADGIRVFGYLGPKAVVRHNDIARFTRGIVVHPLPLPNQPIVLERAYQSATQNGTQWLVADNLLESVGQPIVAPACMLVGNCVV